MLLTGTETLHRAGRQGWALPAFAVYNLEMIQPIVTAAEEADRLPKAMPNADAVAVWKEGRAAVTVAALRIISSLAPV